MIIEDITIHNIGAFKGRHSIDLMPGSHDRPVILLGAMNGSGKTTLLDSLQLGLYGKRAKSLLNFEKYDRHLYQLINRDVAAADGAAIEITFQLAEEGETRHYCVRRSWSGSENRIKESVDVMIDGDHNTNISENWADEIDRILPPSLARLFFFDGEKIEALADPAKAAGIIRSGIYSLLGLELVDTLQDDLKALQRKHSKQKAQNANTKEITEASVRIDSINKELNSLQTASAEQRDKRARAETVKSKSEEKYDAAGGALFGARKDTEKNIALAEAEAQVIDDKLRDLAAGPLPLLLLKSQLEMLTASTTSEHEVKEAAASYKTLESHDRKILEWLTAQEESPTLINNLESFLELQKKNLRKLADKRTNFNLSEGILDSVINIVDNDTHARKELEYLIKEREQKLEKLASLNQKLARTPDDTNIQKVLQERSDARLLFEQESRRYEELEARQFSLKEERSKLQQKVDDFIRTHSKSDRFNNYILRINTALDEFRQLTLMKHVGSLERHITEAFKALIRKDSLVKRITIDPDTFAVSIINKDEQSVPAFQLSAGERQLLATAILWGLARAAGRQLPVVIDTPLGRLDGDHRRNLVEQYFPEASHQVVLLSTDEEIDEKFNQSLESSITHRYLLEFDDKARSTSIKSGYFWKTTS